MGGGGGGEYPTGLLNVAKLTGAETIYVTFYEVFQWRLPLRV